MSSSTSPIGILDSGIGGLAVLSKLKKALPNEHFVYLADNANLPYGNKTHVEILQYIEKAIAFFKQQNCKVVVVACHTASIIINQYRLKIKDTSAIIIDMVKPTLEEIEKSNKGKIGVIGTKYTIDSGIYEQEIKKLNITQCVAVADAPGLVSLTESLYHNEKNNVAKLQMVEEYLKRLKLTDNDSLVLACTHYIHLRPYISSFYSNKVKIIDGSQTAAQKTIKALVENRILNKGEKNYDKFISSKKLYSFEKFKLL